MNASYRHRSYERGRARRFALGLLASVGMAAVLLTALHFTSPHARPRTLDDMPPTSAVSNARAKPPVQRGALVLGAATFHEDADLRDAAREPDPSARAVAAYEH